MSRALLLSLLPLVAAVSAGALPAATPRIAAHALVQDSVRPDSTRRRADTVVVDTSKKKTPGKKDLPLEAARIFDLDTDEGSWLSVDLTADGRTLVFDLLGDLYILPIGGGDALPLTSGMAFDMQPRVSPDGRSVVFISDRDGSDNLWTIDLATKRTKQVTKGQAFRYVSPEWTPDGNYIVASRVGFRTGLFKLWMFHKDGGSGVQLVRGPTQPGQPDLVTTMSAAFGADARYIWLSERSGPWHYNALHPQWQLAVYDRETGRRDPRSARFGSAFRPTLSPDGKLLVYGTRFETKTGLRLRELESGEERWLAFPIQRDDQESRASRDVLPGMTFTPDSKELIASYDGKLWRIPVDGSKPVNIPFRVRTKVELGPKLAFQYAVDDSAEMTVRQIRDAVPSPDGKRLAFVALDRLYVMDWPNGTPRRVTTNEVIEAQPAWSRDGSWLAYITWEETGGHIYKWRTVGSATPQRLTRVAATYQNPVWSPTGSRIVAIRGAAEATRESIGMFNFGQATDLVWVPAAGGAATMIAPMQERGNPHFAADTTRIYLSGGAAGLISIRWDGTDQRNHVRVTGVKPPDAQNPPNAQQITMSPAGTEALAQVGNDLYVVSVAMVGGETPTVAVGDPATAMFPARRLTDVGGQFAGWTRDGTRVHWSLGNAYVVYDLAAARALDDTLAAEARAKEEAAAAAGTPAAAPDTAKKREYKPVERRIVIRTRRDIPRSSVVLRGARVVTMKGNEVIENADIVIRDNRIVGVGARASVQAPADARVIDVSGKTIVPGFVDTHAHMWPNWGLHQTQPWLYLANLAYGVTTTRDPQTATTDVLTYGDMVESGRSVGPRIYSTGPGVFWEEQVRDLDHARKILRRYSDYYDTKTIKMYVAGNRQQRQWIIMAAKEQKLMPTTEGSLDMRLNLTEIIDGYPGQEHSFPIFPLYKDVVGMTAFSGIAYTPTLLVSYGGPWAENFYYTTEKVYDDPKLRRFTPYEELASKARRRMRGAGDPGPGGGWFMPEEYVFTDHAKVANEIVKAGGRVGIGSHGQLNGLGYHWELWSVASGGMTNHDALRAATIHGAEAIGLATDLGSIEAGKLADLIVLDANPLENIRNTNTIRSVMVNGRLRDGDTLDEIYPRQKKMETVPGIAERPVTAAGEQLP